MGLEDKAKNVAEGVQGNMKQVVGDATDDDSMKTEGKADKKKSDLKQAGEKVKDALGGN